MRSTMVIGTALASLALVGFRCPGKTPTGGELLPAPPPAGGAGGTAGAGATASTVAVGSTGMGGSGGGGNPPPTLSCSTACGQERPACQLACENQADLCPSAPVPDCYAGFDSILGATQCVLEECPEMAWSEVCRVTCVRLGAAQCLGPGVTPEACEGGCTDQCEGGTRTQVLGCALMFADGLTCDPLGLDTCMFQQGMCTDCASNWGNMMVPGPPCSIAQ